MVNASKSKTGGTQSPDALQTCRGQPHAGMVGCFCEVIRINGVDQTDKPKSNTTHQNTHPQLMFNQKMQLAGEQL